MAQRAHAPTLAAMLQGTSGDHAAWIGLVEVGFGQRLKPIGHGQEGIPGQIGHDRPVDRKDERERCRKKPRETAHMRSTEGVRERAFK